MSGVSSLQELLVSPSLKEERKDGASHMNVVSQVAVGTGFASCALGLYGFLLTSGWPVTGGGLAVFGVCGALVSREVFWLSRNYAHMLRASFPDRGLWAVSKSACMQRLCQNCYVAEVFLSPMM